MYEQICLTTDQLAPAFGPERYHILALTRDRPVPGAVAYCFRRIACIMQAIAMPSKAGIGIHKTMKETKSIPSGVPPEAV